MSEEIVTSSSTGEDFAQARALVGRERRDLLEPAAIDELGDDHALAAQVGHDIRDDDERVAAATARDGAVVRRL
jgi:hypothetical protein